MSFKTVLINTVKILISILGLFSAFCSIIDLMRFLSIHNSDITIKHTSTNDILLSTSWNLLINMSLLSLFMIQHSFLASSKLKDFINHYHIEDIYRSFYVLTTSAALEILITNWCSIPEIALWTFNVNYRPYWWLYMSIHVVAWILIYVGNICMDINELLGIKQVYYRIVNLPDPNCRKSEQLKRLNSHMRHPSFVAFLLLFWVVPVMSLDRLLLGIVFTVYMYIAWNTDEIDYSYQKTQYIRKFYELEHLRN